MRRYNRIRRSTIPGALLLAPALLLAAAGAAHAQNQGFGLEANAGYYTLGGDDFEGLEGALGFEAIGSWAWPSGFEFGIGAGISGHEFEEIADAADTDVDLISVFAQPTYRFNAAATATPHIHPFIGARAGYARASFETEEGDIELEGEDQSGFSAGGVGGVEVWLSDQVGLTGSVLFDFLSFGEVEDIPDSDASGTRLGFRGGLKVRFN